MLQRILVILAVAGCILLNQADYSFSHTETEEGHNEWNPISAGHVTTWTAPLCGKGKFVAQPFLFYNRTRGVFNSEGHYDSLAQGNKKYQFQQQLFGQYGITDKLEIDGQTVYQENYIKQSGLKAHSEGLGDSYIFLRYCAIEEKGWVPHLTGLFQIKAPTGKYQHADPDRLGTDLMGAASGGGSWDHGYGIMLTKKVKPFLLHMDAAYSFPQEVKLDGVKTIYGEYLNYDFGVEYFLAKGFNPALPDNENLSNMRKGGVNLMLEFNGFLQQDKKQNGSKIPSSDINYLTIAPGFGWSNEKIQALVAYQRTLTGTNTDANDSMVFTFVYTF